MPRLQLGYTGAGGSILRLAVIVGALVGAGCRTPCSDSTAFHTDGSGTALELARERTLAMTGWMDHRCVADVWVTENAALGGEFWREKDGWQLSVHPLDLEDTTLERLICTTQAYESRPHFLTRTLGDNPFDAFVEQCQHGPSTRIFPEQAVSCGAEPWSEREEFFDLVVFPHHTVPRSPTWDLTEGPQLWKPRADRASWYPARRIFDGAWLRPRLNAVILESLDGHEEVPIQHGIFSAVRAADTDAVYAVRSVLDQHALWRTDRQTHEILEIPVEWDEGMTLWGGASAVLGDEIVVATPADRPVVGELYLIPKEGGIPGRIVLPLGPAAYTSVEELWVDPSRKKSMVAWVAYQNVQGESDFSFIARFGVDLLRVDLDGGTTPMPRPEDVPATPEGVTEDGAVVYTVPVEGGTLVMKVDPVTGERAVLPTCVEDAFVLGPDLVTISTRRDREDLWQAWR